MESNIKQQLMDVYNILYATQVQGDSAFKVVNCISIIGSLLQQIESNENENSKNK